MRDAFRILLVEDNQDHADLERHVLSDGKEPIEIHHAPDGLAALNYLRTARSDKRLCPHLIILDINMPGLDGFGVLEEVKTDRDFLHIPTVMFSSSGSADEIKRAMNMRANSFSTKPGDFNRLEERLLEIRSYWMSTHAR